MIRTKNCDYKFNYFYYLIIRADMEERRSIGSLGCRTWLHCLLSWWIIYPSCSQFSVLYSGCLAPPHHVTDAWWDQLRSFHSQLFILKPSDSYIDCFFKIRCHYGEPQFDWYFPIHLKGHWSCHGQYLNKKEKYRKPKVGSKDFRKTIALWFFNFSFPMWKMVKMTVVGF